jgi:hypothetical protein
MWPPFKVQIIVITVRLASIQIRQVSLDVWILDRKTDSNIDLSIGFGQKPRIASYGIKTACGLSAVLAMQLMVSAYLHVLAHLVATASRLAFRIKNPDLNQMRI